jgi:integrase/recombinase XerD
MKQYEQKVKLFFELKGTPDSSRESYWRRMWAFLNYMQKIKRPIEELNHKDIQQYILYLKKEKNFRQEPSIIIFQSLNFSLPMY